MSDIKFKINESKRKAIFEQLTSLYAISKKLSAQDTRMKHEFMVKSSNIDNLYDQYNRLCDEYNELQLSDDPDFDIDNNIWLSFEDLYTAVKHARSQHTSGSVIDQTIKSSSSSSLNAHREPDIGIKLPKLDLPKFDGKPENWPLFFESYKTNIHNNSKLSDAQRILYLVGSLQGKALSVFAGILPTAENYPSIWNALTDKYQDKRLLAASYLNNIFELKNVSSDPSQLNDFIEKLASAKSALKQLEIPDLSDFIFLYFAQRKLDSSLVQNFELTVRDKEIPSSEDLIKFLRHSVKVLERISDKKVPIAKAVPKQTFHTFALTNESSSGVLVCPCCKSNTHVQLYTCPKFKAMEVGDRFTYVKDNKCCTNCLSSKHSHSCCRSKITCRSCSGFHHSLLHRQNKINYRNPSITEVPKSKSEGSFNAALVEQPRNIENTFTATLVDNPDPITTEASVNLPCNDASVTLAALHSHTSKTTIVLSTAQVFAYKHKSNKTIIRCLLDSASQHNIISIACCKQLKLKVIPLNNSFINSIGSNATQIIGFVILTIQSRYNAASYNIKLLVVPHIVDNLPAYPMDKTAVPDLSGLPLADDTWGVPGPVHAILGAQLFPHLITGKCILHCTAPTPLYKASVLRNYNDSALHSNASAPLVNASALIQNDSAPLSDASTPFNSASAPLNKHSALHSNASAPLVNASALINNNSAPLSDASTPCKGASAPCKGASALLNKHSALHSNSSAPLVNASALINNNSAPLSDASTPCKGASAPCKGASALLNKHSALHSNSSAPLVNASALINNNSAPLSDASTPCKGASAPLNKHSALHSNASASLVNASALSNNNSAPLSDASTPCKSASAPLNNASALINNHSAPLSNASTPLINASTPLSTFARNRNSPAPFFNPAAPSKTTLSTSLHYASESVINDTDHRHTKSALERTTYPLPVFETSLGYVIMGEMPACRLESADVAWSFGPVTNDELNDSLTKFWESEEIFSNKIQDPDDVECEELYTVSVSRDPDSGRFVVALPFKKDPACLGNSFQVAKCRLVALERKFKKNVELRSAYNSVLTDYIEKGYLTEIPLTPESVQKGYIIPHHAVVKPDKTTTKTRVVLDASAATDSKVSLNDILHAGPNLQADLFVLLLKFRLLPIAISADVQQMYLRLLVRQDHRKYQKILFRFTESEPLRLFQFNSVAFGLRSSPFLAMRSIRQLASDHKLTWPLAAEVANNDIYMDDITTSVASVEIGVNLSRQLLELFKSGGFNLVKWASNSPELLAHVPESHRAAIEFSDGDNIKILGLKWLPTSDTFTFTTSKAENGCTKRIILSVVARLFDVLGLVAPVILYSKLLIQELWSAQIGWDEEVPDSISHRFLQFTEELPLLSQLQIPRHLGVSDSCEVNLVAFGDASLRAYGCAVYLHVTCPNGDVSLNLVCSKSKVASPKIASLARLELCAAVLLSKTLRCVYDTYNNRYPIENIYAFSDSTVALSWIHSQPHRWQTYVANRVSKIHELVQPERFFHIEGAINPSDCASRGLLPSQILNHKLWWSGPSWARSPIAEWPTKPFKPPEEDLPEARKSVVFTTVAEIEDSPLYDLALRSSSWMKFLRVVVYVLRMVRKLPRGKLIESADLEAAELTVMKMLQLKYFSKDIKIIAKKGLSSITLRKLDPFIDQFGLLRVGGRLSNANVPFENRHPILLPRRDHVVNLLIDHHHRINCHTGSHLLTSLLRQRYWIISARNVIRQRVRSCIPCFKRAPKNVTPIMGNLPPARVLEAKAFTHTGVDYAGPVDLTMTRHRGVRSTKAYICLFVCLCTRAIHLEICSDLSSETFINALKRFIARRGPISTITSDNATNFVGAKRQLDELYAFLDSNEVKTAIKSELANRRITFKTIPPRAPNFGGLWESNIKCVKTHLYRVIGKQILCYEEMLTVLTQIECLLNSRPLGLLPDEPQPEILTPAHFLMTTPLQCLPAYEIDTTKPIIQRKKLLDALVQSYWKKWHLEYLHTLQQKQKWLKHSNNIPIGTVVLVHYDDLPPLHWPLGVIEKVFPGKDSVVRVALVRSRDKLIKRAISKLYPLPDVM